MTVFLELASQSFETDFYYLVTMGLCSGEHCFSVRKQEIGHTGPLTYAVGKGGKFCHIYGYIYHWLEAWLDEVEMLSQL